MLRVQSEIGRLRRVLVHEPGPEVDLMVPAMMEELLFDDILFGERAREEHARLRRVMQLAGVEAVEARDLLAATLEIEDARAWLIDAVCKDAPAELCERLRPLAPVDLAAALISGIRHDAAGDGSRPEELFLMPPAPNWCFQRDPQVVIGGEVVVSSMATPARRREVLLSRTIFQFHPDFAATPVIFNAFETDWERPLFVGLDRPQIEGGDVLVLSEDVLAIGHSARTNSAGIWYLARALARREGGGRWLVVVEIPQRRAYMHLDTIFTPVDRDACLVFPPVVTAHGPERAKVYEVDLHADEIRFSACDSLLGTLRKHGIDLQPIPCGGDDPVMQQREQWTDGANAFCLAPGVITTYERNVATTAQLANHGFAVVPAEDLLLGRHEIDLDRPARICIPLRTHEIARARGGPHCLTHPLERDPI